MKFKKAEEIAKRIRSVNLNEAARIVINLAEKGFDQDPSDPSPLTPSGSIPPYLKPNKKKKRRKKGHPGKSRQVPDHIDEYKEHSLEACPHCQTPLKKTVKTRKRYIEDIPQVEPVVIEHTIHGYWYPYRKKHLEPRRAGRGYA